MKQIWGNMMRSCEIRGRDLLDADVITPADLYDWLKAKNSNEAAIIGVGLPCYSLLQTLLHSIKSNSGGLLLLDDFEVTDLNRPKDKLLEWFFNPVMVLKEQIKAIALEEGEVRFLEKVTLFGSDTRRMEAWENASLVPQDALRAAQIQGICRRYMYFSASPILFSYYQQQLHLEISNTKWEFCYLLSNRFVLSFYTCFNCFIRHLVLNVALRI